MLKKGGPVFVDGRLQTRNWEGQDGVKRYKTEIVADNIIVLSGRGGNDGGGSFMARPKDNPVDEISASPIGGSDKKPDTNTVDEINIEEIPF